MRVLVLIVVAMGFFIPLKADAVCFKAFNETNVTLVARVHDRGRWRDWVTMPPGFWDCFAPKVKRQKHDVEIDYLLPDGTRKPLERDRHGSILFTRVVHFQAEPATNSVKFTYWDEPPGCRDKPKGQGRTKSCLKEPGWLKKIAIDWLIKVAKWGGNKLAGKEEQTQPPKQGLTANPVSVQPANQGLGRPVLVFGNRVF